MSYSKLTLANLQHEFGLTLTETVGLFATAPPVEPPELLSMILTDNVPLAIAIGTEKARSELIVMPILVALRKHFHNQISLFSGVEFNVDGDRNLTGVCDFLLSRSPQQLLIQSPVVALVEAKNDNLKSGLAQCLAEMVAAQVFNARQDTGINTIYGAVTTGTAWQFLQLQGQQASIDLDEYSLKTLDQIFGILVGFLAG
ncbi:MAG: hypothetical protein AAGG51_23845 [Cyanobacteria bacterium P01_G01_bin.54]